MSNTQPRIIQAALLWDGWLKLETLAHFKTYVRPMKPNETVTLSVTGGSKFRVAVTNGQIPQVTGSLKTEKVIFDDNLKSYTYKNTANYATLVLYYASAGDSAVLEDLTAGDVGEAPVIVPKPDAQGFYSVLDYLPANPKSDGSVDYTSLIQEALNKHAKILMPNFRLAVNDAGLRIPSNSTVELQNATLFVKTPTARASYSVISLVDTDNVTFKGTLRVLGDKDAHTGTAGEQGHGIDLKGAHGVTFENDVIVDKCWGDGLYVGQSATRDRCKNIKIMGDLISKGNRRQGMTVISVEGLDIERAYLESSEGTDPEAGLCLEPNDSTGVLKGIRINKLYTKNNAGYGLHVYLRAVTQTIAGNEVDVVIGYHEDTGSLSGFYLTGDLKTKGSIKILKAKYSNNQRNGVFQRDTDGDNVQTTFNELHVDAPNMSKGAASYSHAVRIENYTAALRRAGGLHIVQLTTSNLTAGAQLIYADAINTAPFSNVTLGHSETVEAKVMNARSKLFLTGSTIRITEAAPVVPTVDCQAIADSSNALFATLKAQRLAAFNASEAVLTSTHNATVAAALAQCILDQANVPVPVEPEPEPVEPGPETPAPVQGSIIVGSILWNDWVDAAEATARTYVRSMVPNETVVLSVVGGSRFRLAATSNAVVAGTNMQVTKIVYDDKLKTYTYKNTAGHKTLMLYFSLNDVGAYVVDGGGSVPPTDPVVPPTDPVVPPSGGRATPNLNKFPEYTANSQLRAKALRGELTGKRTDTLGLVPNSTVDQSAKLQQIANGLVPGDVLLIPAGTYVARGVQVSEVKNLTVIALGKVVFKHPLDKGTAITNIRPALQFYKCGSLKAIGLHAEGHHLYANSGDSVHHGGIRLLYCPNHYTEDCGGDNVQSSMMWVGCNKGLNVDPKGSRGYTSFAMTECIDVDTYYSDSKDSRYAKDFSLVSNGRARSRGYGFVMHDCTNCWAYDCTDLRSGSDAFRTSGPNTTNSGFINCKSDEARRFAYSHRSTAGTGNKSINCSATNTADKRFWNGAVGSNTEPTEFSAIHLVQAKGTTVKGGVSKSSMKASEGDLYNLILVSGDNAIIEDVEVEGYCRSFASLFKRSNGSTIKGLTSTVQADLPAANVMITLCDDTTVEDSIAKGGRQGIRVNESLRSLVQRAKTSDTSVAGIQVDAGATGATVRNNKVTHTKGVAYDLAAGTTQSGNQ